MPEETAIPFNITIEDDVCTIHMHHLVVNDNNTPDGFHWDDECCDNANPTPLHKMSTVLNLLLPYPLLCSSNVERLYLLQRNIAADILSVIPKQKRINDLTFAVYVTGSRGEGLSIPVSFSFDNDLNLNFISRSDLDLLVVIPFSPKGVNGDSIQTEGVHPGFFRYSGPETIFAAGVSRVVSEQAQLMGEINGPSVLANTPMKAVDHVVTFRFHGWPKVAAEFCQRKRNSGWPSEEILKEISESDCNMVLKPHPFTAQSVQNEWRFSFSLAEKRLAASLTKSQKLVYIYFKLLHREFFQFPNEISSYHLKTLLFWECEKVAFAEWSHQDVASRLLSLLKQFHQCLKDHILPSYFIPQNNLIDHIPAKRVQELEKVVRDIKDNLLKYIFRILKTTRFMGYPLTLETEEMENITKVLLCSENNKSESNFRDLAVDIAVKCASWHVADFYLSEKVLLDTSLYYVQPGEGTLAANLIKCYLQNRMMPLKSAQCILQRTWSDNEGKEMSQLTNEGSVEGIFKCLVSIGDTVTTEHLKMINDDQTDKILQEFLDHENPEVQIAREKLQVILDKEVIPQIHEPTSGTYKLQIAWNVLLHLVAYCFMINGKDKVTGTKYLIKIQFIKDELSKFPCLEDLFHCSQQLQAFSLLVMGQYDDVKLILTSSVLKPRAAAFLEKLLVMKRASSRSNLVTGAWAWESISIAMYNAQPKEQGSAFIDEWLGCLSESDNEHICGAESRDKALPVGRVFEIHDRTFQDSCLMRWDVDAAHNLLVPQENFLQPGLQAMMEKLLITEEGVDIDKSKHPTCRLAVAKCFILTGATEKAVYHLRQVLADPRSAESCYRIFPRESQLMLDDRVLSEKKLLIRDHFDFCTILYALFLLVRCYKEKGEGKLAEANLDHIRRLCQEKLENANHYNQPWQVTTNCLTLFGTAATICGKKQIALRAFIFAKLVSEIKGPLAERPNDMDLAIEGTTIAQTVMDGISLLSKYLHISAADAFRCCLDMLYPEVTLKTAVNRLVAYCTDGGLLLTVRRELYQNISALRKNCKQMNQ